MLVGTAMTGQSTSPPTTLGNAPSMPATTTIASAPPSAFICWSRRCSPATPTSASSVTAQFHASAVTRASSATGRSLVPGRDHHHLPQLRAGVERPAQPERPPQRIRLPVREHLLQVAADRRLDARDQPPLLVAEQRLQDAFDLLGRLPLAEDHLGETAAEPAVDVDVGEPHLLERHLAELQDRVRRRDPTCADPLEQLRQLM